MTPLNYASREGRYDTVKFLLDLNGRTINSRVDTTKKNRAGWSPLHTACIKGHIEVVKLLIKVGMNINDKTNSGSTPLHKACQEGHFDTVKLLLDLNSQVSNGLVDTTIKDEKGWLAVHVACDNGHIEVVKLFFEVGINLNVISNSGSTPLYLACKRGHFETAKYLIELNDQISNSRVDTRIQI
ncbi:unnamed protein product [Mytilus edulis]|uniref:Uncharacterized protein n=1 Tax=Mytilus edulis TaxID=6550 RepID=A0A8S3PY23_MYTED|nr:unnamed protein product [Mytilus edulis]